MAIRMVCPNGHELVTEDQYAGRTVRCPHCQVLLVVPGAPATAVRAEPPQPTEAPRKRPRDEIDERDVIDERDEIDDRDVLEEGRPRRRRRRDDDYDREPPEDDYEDEPRPRKKKKKKGLTRQQLSLTNLGLAFHYARLLVYLIGMATVIAAYLLVLTLGAGMAASRAARSEGPGTAGAGLLGLVMALALIADIAMVFVAPILGITGSILCCWVPHRTGARPLIMTSLGLDGGALLLPIIGLLVAGTAALRFDPGASAAALVFFLLSPLCALAGFILFMLFCRRLAGYLGEHGAADEAIAIIINLVVLIVSIIVLVVAVFILALLAVGGPSRVGAGPLREPGTGAQVMGCFIGLLFLAGFITWLVFVIKWLFRTLNLIGSLRQHLRTRYGV
jgi:hypothetical protein